MVHVSPPALWATESKIRQAVGPVLFEKIVTLELVTLVQIRVPVSFVMHWEFPTY